MTLDDLNKSLEELNLKKELLAKLKLKKLITIKDILYYFPYKYIDLTTIKKIKELTVSDEKITLVGKIKNIKAFSARYRKLFIISATLSDSTGMIKVIWYNQPFLLKHFRKQPYVLIYGKVSFSKNILVMQSPKVKILGKEKFFRLNIIPVYSEFKGIKSRTIANIIDKIFHQFAIDKIDETLPPIILKRLAYPTLGEALSTLHKPKTLKSIDKAQQRIAFEEILYLELASLLSKLTMNKNKAPIIHRDEQLIQSFLQLLNLSLTQGQKKILDDIFQDLKKGTPMNRLLQGETGSGKTLIAEIASLNTVVCGYQVILMTPTEILAQQHFERLKNDFKNFNLGLGLITSGQIFYAARGFKAKKKISDINRYLILGDIKILIGTHSLIKNNLSFNNIGLVIIDEQQRFGVEQRQQLLSKSKQKLLPHFLSMTATPIPRTLALALYSDLDLSYLPDKPPGFKQVKTYIVYPNKKNIMWDFIRKELQENHQAFIVCPRIEDKEDEIASVKKEYQNIKNIFPKANVALLHGKMHTEEKEKILKLMQANKINILVSSSVIEVGIDLPLVTVIVILSPERFGLAQLYQLRGRVGRSVHQGYCFLAIGNLAEKSKKRLRLFLQSDSALKLAEYDLRLRGPGELFGIKQSGLSDLAMRSLVNLDLLKKAKIAARYIFNRRMDNNFSVLLKKASFYLNFLKA